MTRLVFGRPGVVLPSAAYARILTVDATTVAFESTFDALLVRDLKAQIPFTARRWEKDRKRWLVDRAYAGHCASLAQQYLGVTVTVPAAPAGGTPAHATLEQRLVRLEYLGRCKERQVGTEATAMGYADGAWSLVFPEGVLRRFFDPDPETPRGKNEPQTLFAILCVKSSATPDEIKSAYRRMARQWHPDTCHEPDAAERFIALQAAYETLADPMKRKRYDVGLLFEQQSKVQDPYVTGPQDWNSGDYAPPLRCGWVLVSGRSRLGVFHVEQIEHWEDVVDERGRVLVTSWPKGGQHFVTTWVEP